MEHPFITSLSDKSLEDLQTSISDLTKKLNFAYSMQNGPMIHQLCMVLDSYKKEYGIRKRTNQIRNRVKAT